MRIVKAQLTDSYRVHKTLSEYFLDKGDPLKLDQYSLWVDRLTNDLMHYHLLMHGRGVVGMIWGREIPHESKKTLLIEGRYLRRAYKNKFKFKKEMLLAQEALSKDFERVQILLPKNGVKLKKYKVLGTLVEVSK